ncbi:MAG: hypothetical protein AAFU55_09055, partial [Pseudomonadota bacterium]
PLKRVIQKAVQDPLAEMLLGGEIKDGSTVEVSAGDEGLIIGGVVRPLGGSPKTPPPAVLH